MTGGDDPLFGLSAGERIRLLARLTAAKAAAPAPERFRLDPAVLAGYREVEALNAAAAQLNIANPYFREHDGIAGAQTTIGGRVFDNFASYDYLGLNGHPAVTAAAKEAIDRYGTSVSASRMVSGERAIHLELEHALAATYGAEDGLTLVSGHATNTTLIGLLLGREDVIVHDSHIHNSVTEGVRLAGARRLSFPHLDVEAAGRLLAEARPHHRHALIAIEGHYSMDGDVPDLAAFVEVARRHRAWLMVDEAHALGVLGTGGRGLAEHAGVDPGEVDIWMGTLSKSLVSSGGYVAGSRRLIDFLRHRLPGFVFSVGLMPAAAAAARAALEAMNAEPRRIARLRCNAALFLRLAREGGLDTGGSIGAGIVPIVIGGSVRAASLAQALFARGINVLPILYPAVPERSARLRFFVTSAHDEAQLRRAAAILVEQSRAVSVDPAVSGREP